MTNNIDYKQMKAYIYQDNAFSFEGNVSVEKEKEWVAPWRIDYGQFEFYPFLTDEVAKDCSGIRLSFTTNSKNIILQLAKVEEGMMLDLFVNDVLNQEITLDKSSNQAIFKQLPLGLKRIDIWLDQRFPFKLKRIFIDEEARICKTKVNKKRWVHYGSSISHSIQGRRPSKIWTSLVAQKLNLHLINFGFGGNCMCEPMIGRIIRDLPADYITLKLGINLYAGSLSQRTFSPNVIGLIQIIREKHPRIPLAIISPIYSPPREKVKGGSGLSLEDMRNILSDIVASCKKYGDNNIYYVDGLKIFGPEEIKYLPDELHPNAEGQFILADHFVKEVFWKFPGI